MSWHFLQERVEAYWPHTSLVGAPSALLKMIPTANESCLPARKTEPCPLSPSGTISEPLMENRGKTQLTLFPEDSLAKTSASLETKKELPVSIQAFILKCYELSKKYDLHLYLSKTLQTYVPMDYTWSSKVLPNWGITADGACWEVATSTRPMTENEFGLLATPTSRDYRSPKASQKTLSKKHRPLNEELYNAILGKNTKKASSYKKFIASLRQHNLLKHHYETPPKNLGGIFHTIREWMMGWPIGCTALKPLETDKFRQWQSWLGEF